MEFHHFRSTSRDQLPAYDSRESGSIDLFWTTMAEVHSVADLEIYRFPFLSRLAQALLVWLQ